MSRYCLSVFALFLGCYFSINAATTLPEPKEFVVFTMPKTGTHLLIPFLEVLTGKLHRQQDIFTDLYTVSDYSHMQDLLSNPDVVQTHWWVCPIPQKRLASTLDQLYRQNEFMVSHAPYLPSTEALMYRRNCVVFHILRDPRDSVVSLYYHLKIPNMLFAEEEFQSADQETQFNYIINGTDWFNSTHTIVHRFLPWIHSSVCCTLRFEKLIGPSGGACTREEHIKELRKIKTALGLETSDAELLDLFDEIYGSGLTFRQGIVGTWKDYFRDYQKEMFKEMLGDVLIGLGYERDYNW